MAELDAGTRGVWSNELRNGRQYERMLTFLEGFGVTQDNMEEVETEVPAAAGGDSKREK